jgi:hypothetical protein
MKNLRYFSILLAFVALLTILMVGCDLFGISISTRVTDFQDQLNYGRNLQSQFHPSIKPLYSSYTLDSVFDGSPLAAANNNYLISMTGSDYVHTSNIQAWDGTISCDNYLATDIHFYFEKSGSDWYILAILIDSLPIAYNVGQYTTY